MTLLQSLKNDLIQALKNLAFIQTMPSKSDKLYDTAISFLGKDASPDDLANDMEGCAESVSDVIRTAFPEMNFPTLLSTRTLFDYLRKSPSFVQVSTLTKGDIIISVTGTGILTHGHTGICGKNESPDGSYWIMSNNSFTGTWEANYSLNSWNRYFRDKGGLSTVYFAFL